MLKVLGGACLLLLATTTCTYLYSEISINKYEKEFLHLQMLNEKLAFCDSVSREDAENIESCLEAINDRLDNIRAI